ncbi:hypothetical protein ACS0TY_000005 [Phlomoides rotata]
MDGENNNIWEFLEESDATNFGTSDDILSILEFLDSESNNQSSSSSSFEFQYNNNNPLKSSFPECETSEVEPKCKRQKVKAEIEPRNSHIAVERNRRKQMNHQLFVLRSLMPCFYVKRGDQASIIGGVINYINELQQVMQSLEAKKQRSSSSSSYDHHPRVASSPRMVLVSPLISPRTPSSPYMLHSPCTSSSASSINADTVNELVATSRSAIAEVEVKFCGPNLVVKTVSHRIPGQVVKILSALQHLALEILQVNINNLHDQTMLNSFTIKVISIP